MVFQPASSLNAELTRRLKARLMACPIEGTVTYNDLDVALGRQSRDYRHLIQAAKRQALREGVHFRTVYRVGFQRLRGGEVKARGLAYRAKTISGGKRTANEIGYVIQYGNDMTQAELRDAYQEAAHCRLIAMVAGNKKPQQIEDLAYAAADPGQTMKDSLERMREALGRVR
jgi:hypothetical protein